MSLDKPWTRAYSDQDLSSLEEFLSSNDSPPATRRTTPLLDSLMPSLSVLKNNSITETDSLMENKYSLNPDNLDIDATTGFIRHQVAQNDTLEALALNYGVSVPSSLSWSALSAQTMQLKKVNKLWNGEHLFLKKNIIIPTTREKLIVHLESSHEKSSARLAEKNEKLKRFMQEMVCEENVARNFLNRSNYRYDKAVRRYKRILERQRNPWAVVPETKTEDVEFYRVEDDSSSFSRTIKSVFNVGGEISREEVPSAHTWTPKSLLRRNAEEDEEDSDLERTPFISTSSRRRSYGNLTNSGYGRDREIGKESEGTDVYTELYGL